MPKLSEISELLQDTEAAMAQMERALAQSDQPTSIRLMLGSLEKQHASLETEFLAEAVSTGVDVCSYRMFADDERPKAAAVGRALEQFQSLLSTVHGAVLAGAPRRGGKLSAEALASSSLDFGYAFAGSVGFVMTMPNERLLLGDSKLDDSFKRVFEMTQTETPEQIKAFAGSLGPSAVRALYRWTKGHTSAGMGADIEWKRGKEVRAAVLLQLPELERLRTNIEAIGDISEQVVPLSAMLVGFHSEKGTFDLALEGKTHIHGYLSKDLSLTEPVRVPARYMVRLRKVTQTRFSIDEDEITYYLEHLELLGSP